MDFTLSSEQALLKQAVDRFVAEHYSDGRLVRDANTQWSAFAELGWLALPVPEARGGFGGSALDTAIVMEAFGAGPVAQPYVSSAIVGGSLLAACDGEAADAALERLVDGTSIAALAYAEPHAGYDPEAVRTTARADGDSFVVSGEKVAVPFGNAAGVFIVSVRAGGEGISLLRIAADAAGLRRRDYVTYDDRQASDLTLDDVRVPSSALIGPLHGGLPLLEAALDRGTVALCAEALGAMGVLQRRTVEYLKTRSQFGRPIGSFQALQHRAVDMLVQLELARSITTYAASVVDGDDIAVRRRAAAAAKVLVSDASRFVTEQAIQLHGAIGLTEELYVGHYAKRLTMLQRELGDAAYAVKRYIAAG
jgi:alkylation response protein AidB-like acyl-CoA dehydrogenase